MEVCFASYLVPALSYASKVCTKALLCASICVLAFLHVAKMPTRHNSNKHYVHHVGMATHKAKVQRGVQESACSYGH